MAAMTTSDKNLAHAQECELVARVLRVVGAYRDLQRS